MISEHQSTAAPGRGLTTPSHRLEPAALTVVGAAALWGTMGPVAALYPSGSPLAVAAWRLNIGALALAATASISRRGWSRWRWSETPTTAAGVLAVAAYSALYFQAVQLSGVATATVVSIGAAPLVSGATHAVTGGPVDRRWLAGTSVAVTGMCLVVLPGAHDPASWFGILLAALAAASYACQAHSIERLSPHHGPMETVAVLFAGAAVVYVPISISGIGLATASPLATAGTIYLGLFTTAIAYGMFASGIPRVGAPTAVSISLLEPVVATALAALIAHEIPSAVQVVGIAITLTALGHLTGRSI